MRGLILAIFLVTPLTGWSQQITISGKVQDRETGEPLEFASVGIRGKSAGTVTNLQGEFDFHFPAAYRNEILTVNMLGYKTYEVPIWSILDGGYQTIQMEKSPTVLEEVTVSDSLSGGDILRIAFSRIEENFPMQPFLMDAFYRDVKRVGGTYISLLETAVQIYDEDYTEPRNKGKLREHVRLIEVRKSLGYENKFTKYFDQDNLLEDLLLHNNIRYRQIELREEFYSSMGRDKDSYYNDHPIYVVSHHSAFHLKFYIDKLDYSIVHMEYETGFSNDEAGRRKGLISRFAGLKKTIDFRKYDGKMYLNYINIISKVNWYDSKTNELKFESELFQQLLVNEIHVNTAERISSTEKMKNYGLQYQDQPYNKKFWDNYNVIKETPLDIQIKEDLEKAAISLEKQFKGGY